MSLTTRISAVLCASCFSLAAAPVLAGVVSGAPPEVNSGSNGTGGLVLLGIIATILVMNGAFGTTVNKTERTSAEADDESDVIMKF